MTQREQKSTGGERRGRRLAARLAVVAVRAGTAVAAPGLSALLGREPAPAATAPAAPAPDPRPSPTSAPGAAASPSPTGPADDPVAGAPPRLSEPIRFDREASLRAGRIVIPAIGLDTTYGIGVHDAVLEEGPGHWPDTALPGQAGNGVLSGHRTTWTHPFGDLDRLAPGDVVTASVGPQPGVDYRVTGVQIVPEAEYVDVVLRQPDDPTARQLTLFACHPKGSRTHRIVVTAQADPLPAPPGAG